MRPPEHHPDHPLRRGRAAGGGRGRPRRGRGHRGAATAGGRPAALAVVACAAGAATEALCRDAGATVVPSAPGARASTGDVLDAVLAAGASGRRVLVLPNDNESAAVAHQAGLAAEEQGVTAVVARSRSQVQVLAALAVLEPRRGRRRRRGRAALGGRRVEGCRYGAVAVAARATAHRRPDPAGSATSSGRSGARWWPSARTPSTSPRRWWPRLGDGHGAGHRAAGRGRRRGVAGALRRAARGRRGSRSTSLGGGQPRYLLLLGCE